MCRWPSAAPLFCGWQRVKVSIWATGGLSLAGFRPDRQNGPPELPRRGGRDRRRVTDEDESLLDSHEVSSVASLDRGKWHPLGGALVGC